MERGKGKILIRGKRKTPAEVKTVAGVRKGMDNINPFGERELSESISVQTWKTSYGAGSRKYAKRLQLLLLEKPWMKENGTG